MAVIPTNVVVAWPGTAVSIPAGWSRVTELDSRFVRGAAPSADADLVTDQGNTSHTHTSPAHTPLQDAHRHGVTSTTYAGSKTASGTGSSVAAHNHNATISNFITATNQASTVNFNANASNDPPFVAVIWIKSDGTPTGVPGTAYAFFDSDTLPTNWARTAINQYLKGAVAGADGGATGGALTHTHTSDAHTHGQDTHNHGTSTSATAGTSSTPSNAAILVAAPTHTHDVTLSVNAGSNQSTTNTSNSTNHEPLFTKVNTIVNNGTTDLPDQLIAIYLGADSTIPTNWSRYAALDGYFVKGADIGESLTTGGSQTHTHTAVCQPIQNSHTHTASGTASVGTSNGEEIISGSVVRESNDGHTHTWTPSPVVPTNQALTYNVDACTSEAAYPKYCTAIFIQFSNSRPAITTTTYDYLNFNRQNLIGGGPLPEVARAMWSRRRNI